MIYLLQILEPTTSAYLADYQNSNIFLRFSFFLQHLYDGRYTKIFSFDDMGFTHILGILAVIGCVIFVVRVCISVFNAFKIQKFKRKE